MLSLSLTHRVFLVAVGLFAGWRSRYGYAEAWSWARALDADARARLWRELLALNGFESNCDAMTQ